jgi:hypothetical protein
MASFANAPVTSPDNVDMAVSDDSEEEALIVSPWRAGDGVGQVLASTIRLFRTQSCALNVHKSIKLYSVPARRSQHNAAVVNRCMLAVTTRPHKGAGDPLQRRWTQSLQTSFLYYGAAGFCGHVSCPGVPGGGSRLGGQSGIHCFGVSGAFATCGPHRLHQRAKKDLERADYGFQNAEKVGGAIGSAAAV